MEDTIHIHRVYEEVADRIPGDMTHLMITIPSRNNAVLFRMRDGMYLGEAADKMTLAGENPNKRESRLFLTHGHAKTYLRENVARETDGVQPKIFEHDAEASSLIALPGGEASLVANGNVPTVRRFGGKLN